MLLLYKLGFHNEYSYYTGYFCAFKQFSLLPLLTKQHQSVHICGKETKNIGKLFLEMSVFRRVLADAICEAT